jgi:uracil-DNA glycosylase
MDFFLCLRLRLPLSTRKKHTIYPPPEDTFAALNLCPLSETKLVIVGQDPYHGPNQGHGICFSVRRGIQTPPSLRNIYKELVNDPEVPNFASVPGHGNLERWAKQGVLMINNVLTVRKGQAHSHKKQGWEELTDAILRAVDKRKSFTSNGDDISNSKKPRGVVFLLWGLPATKKTKTALAASSAWSRHTILCSSHPSPLGATKTKAPFMGSRCFSKANEALVEMGYDPIDWRVDGPLP